MIAQSNKDLNMESISMNAFYRKFNYSGLNNFPELSKFKKNQKLDRNQYVAIVKQYLSIYFNEVYFMKRPFYFFLGGKIKLVRCGGWINDTSEAKPAIGLMWYDRPSDHWWFSVSIRKMSGRDRPVPVIEKEWKKKNDVTLLPLASKEKKKMTELKRLFNMYKKK